MAIAAVHFYNYRNPPRVPEQVKHSYDPGVHTQFQLIRVLFGISRVSAGYICDSKSALLMNQRSGCLRSVNDAMRDSILLSIIETAKKQEMNMLLPISAAVEL